jgi:hypothetical protein
LRTQRDGFFSETYLDASIEEVLSAHCSSAVSRSEIFEVTALASRDPRATASFIADIVAFGDASDFAWSFFTLTRRLGLLVRRLGLAPTHLADADHRRIDDVASWGSYYAHQPKVYAVANPNLARPPRSFTRMVCHAQAS